MKTIDRSNLPDMPNPHSEEPIADQDSYRAISWSAVAAMLIAIPSLLAFLIPSLILLSIIAFLLAIHAISTIRYRRDEFTGLRLAKMALCFSLFTGVGGAALSIAIYSTEVPDWANRINWLMLKAEMENGPPPQSAIDLDGEKVFIKGYVLAGRGDEKMTDFILVPDLGTCCFGGNPEMTDQIRVTISDPDEGVGFSLRRRKFAGVLHVDSEWKNSDGSDGVYYHLEAEYIR